MASFFLPLDVARSPLAFRLGGMIGSDLVGKHAFYGLSGGDNHHVKHVFFFEAAMRQIKNTVLRWAAADIPDSQGFLALFSRPSDASEEALAQTA